MISDSRQTIETVGAAAPIGQSALDLKLALSRVGGDTVLLHEIALLFLSDSERMMQEIDQAVSARDPKALDRAAHTIKGCVSSFGAQGLYEASLALERMGRSGDLANVDREHQTLRTEMALLEFDLRALTAQS